MRNERIGKVLFVGFLLGLLLTTLLIYASAANAQVCPAWVDPIVCQTEDTRNILRNNRRQHEANLATYQIERLIRRGDYYGYYNGGTFVPMYDRYRRPISKREGAITGAAIGASIGGAVIGNWRGTAAGASGGALLGFLLSGRGDDGKPVNCSKRKLNRKEQETCAAIAAEQQDAVVQQQVVSQQAEAQRLGQTYYNRTGRPVDVRDATGNLVADIPNGGSVDLPESSGGYRAYMRLPAAPGRTAFRPADQRLAKDGSGFVFIFPVEGGI